MTWVSDAIEKAKKFTTEHGRSFPARINQSFRSSAIAALNFIFIVIKETCVCVVYVNMALSSESIVCARIRKFTVDAFSA